MKKYIITILTIAALSTSAQTNSITPTTLDQIISLVGSPTNYAVEPYGTWAPKAPTKIGGGILAIVNMNQYVGLGIGLDWLGSFSLVSGNVQLSLPFHPLPSMFPTLEMTPFVLGGVATAYSGAGNFTGSVATVADVGDAIKFGHWLGGQFNAGLSWGKWGGVGAYDVTRYHLFAGWSKGF